LTQPRDLPAPAAPGLRRLIKARRRALPAAWTRTHSRLVARRLWRLPVLARARRIACYLPVNGEVDCRFIIAAAWRRGRQVMLPVMRGRRLRFAPWRPGAPTRKNRFGIGEPAGPRRDEVDGRRLDVVVVPLVAFDTDGNRLGMGGGYYDRSFAFRLHRRRWRKPLLIGVAWQFQQAGTLAARAWDVPLDAVITESAGHFFNRDR
jgi:5-formyltetrahydrofolate cyclo-ligase